jgi:hypothetical protein
MRYSPVKKQFGRIRLLGRSCVFESKPVEELVPENLWKSTWLLPWNSHMKKKSSTNLTQKQMEKKLEA